MVSNIIKTNNDFVIQTYLGSSGPSAKVYKNTLHKNIKFSKRVNFCFKEYKLLFKF